MHARDRHAGRGERLDDSKFALDLVRRLEQRAGRLLAHDPARRGSLEQESWIRLPADELPHGQRSAKVGHPLAQIALEATLVEAMIFADGC